MYPTVHQVKYFINIKLNQTHYMHLKRRMSGIHFYSFALHFIQSTYEPKKLADVVLINCSSVNVRLFKHRYRKLVWNKTSYAEFSFDYLTLFISELQNVSRWLFLLPLLLQWNQILLPFLYTLMDSWPQNAVHSSWEKYEARNFRYFL